MTELNLDLPADRIRFALAALEQFRNTPNCRVNMGVYHYADLDGTCYA